jgi:aspartate aminotransferase
MSNEKALDSKKITPWNQMEKEKEDPVMKANMEFKSDPSPQKINLTVGSYKDENGKPFVLRCVKKATEKYLKDSINHEYLPMGGDPNFCDKAIKLAYKSDFKFFNRLYAIQSLSGTGALKIGQRFLSEFYPFKKKIFLSSPTWGNHLAIAQSCHLDIGKYRYYDYKKKKIDFDGMMEDFQNMENHSIVLLHACAHNPTGVDLSHEQWGKLLEIVKKKEILPFFDMAYQGFATGDLDEDAFGVRLFANEGIDMLLAQSFSKNLGMYGERIGCLSIMTQNEEEKLVVKSHLEKIARSEYSCPPKFGAMIVNSVLSDEELKKEWYEDLNVMVNRIKDTRLSLKQKLIELGSKLNWDHLTEQKGMFAFTGLTPEQCDRLKKEFHVYIVGDGRVSVPGLNPNNIDLVAKAFHEVTKAE